MIPVVRVRAWLGLALVLAAAPVHAQRSAVISEPVVPEKVGKELRAMRVTGQPPVIDGRLDDEAWTLAPAIDDFVQNEPDNMAAPRDRTSVQIAYDDRTLYVAVRCFTQDPTTVTTGLGRRDNLPPSDLIRMSFDPRHDHQTAYVFETNPSGMQSDYLFYDDTRQSPDYDAVWEVKTTITGQSWNAEYAIPFSQMRFTVPGGGAPVVWGFNLRRDVYKTGEYDRWVPTPRGAAGFVSRFGHLTFDDSFVPPRRIELLPVAFVRGEDTATGSPEGSAAGGLDMRVGLGTAATLSATINPDFAQVEQDPSVLNLSVFETFYPEKRPFFLEDSRLFVPNFNQMLLFHSRRIGRNPGRLSLPTGDTEIERPDSTTIIGATKLTGKAGATAYGTIAALTAPEFATVDTLIEGGASTLATRRDRLVEPRTGYGVFRVLRDLRGGTSNIGGMATAVVRDGDANAFTGGVDHTFRWDRNRGSLAGIWAGTHAPVSGVQRDGFAGITNVNYDRKYYSVYGHYDHISKNFRNSDIGFLGSRINKTNINYGFNLIQPDPHGIFRNQRLYTYGSQSWNTDNLFFEKRVGNGIDLTFKNFSGFYVEWSRDLDRLDDLDTRGGPPIVKPGMWGIYGGGRTDSRKTWQLFLNANAQRDDEGGTNYYVSESLRLRPSTRLQGQVNMSFQWGRDVAQWIKNEDVTGDGTTDNVYGRLRRNVLSITTRATYAFTRDMTLEAYLQPFVAVGDYTDIRRLAAANSFDFEAANLSSDPDFNNKSLRANIVFRWEYIKGSALFVVWNRSTSDTARPGQFTPFRDLGGAFSGPGSDVVMVKLNYWLGL